MILSKNKGDVFFRCFLIVISVVIAVSVIYPLYFVLLASFSDPVALTNGEVWLIPKKISLLGYQRILEHKPLWIGYRNTIFYTVIGTALSLFVTLLAAYAMSRKDLLLRNSIMIIFTIPMFFSGGLIPTYMVMKNLGLIDNPLVLIIPGCFGIYNMIIARTFFSSSLPTELREAAEIDGCGEMRYFFTIAIPLSKAIIAVIGLYCAVGIWNSYFDALIYIKNRDYVPLQLVLRDILIANSFNERQGAGASTSGLQQMLAKEIIKYSVIVVSTLPIMCVYPFVQKYFAKGVMLGSIKG